MVENTFSAEQKKSSFAHFFIKAFNPFYLLGMLVLSPFAKFIALNVDKAATPVLFFVCLPLVNALLTGLCVLFFGFLLEKYVDGFSFAQKKPAFLIAFIAGLLPIYAAEFKHWVILLPIGVIYVACKNIADFFKEYFFDMMNPEKVITKDGLWAFFKFMASLITTYVVINLSIDSLHLVSGLGKAFNFGNGIEGILDAVYFTFVIITTVGLGGIVPLSPLAKTVVAFECVSSYFILAFVIGVINRGVVKK